MALEYYASIDLNKNELQNAVVHPLGSAPSSPTEGQIYYDSTGGDKQIYVYNGSSWVALGGNKFDTIAVSGQTSVVADGTNDTLTLAAGSNVTITTDAGTDKYSPVKAKPKIPPILANGNTVMIKVAKRTELNNRNKRKKIPAIVKGIIMDKCPSARVIFSNWPPYSI